MAVKNAQGKTVKASEAYEVWFSPFNHWYWYVLKKYQTPEHEEKNQYARWFCLVRGFETEMGDVYISDIKKYAYKLDDWEKAEALEWAKQHGY